MIGDILVSLFIKTNYDIFIQIQCILIINSLYNNGFPKYFQTHTYKDFLIFFSKFYINKFDKISSSIFNKLLVDLLI